MSDKPDGQDCLSDTTITDLLEDKLSPEREQSVKEHLDHCTACQQNLEAFNQPAKGAETINWSQLEFQDQSKALAEVIDSLKSIPTDVGISLSTDHGGKADRTLFDAGQLFERTESGTQNEHDETVIGRLGKFEILEKIGEGGSGVVYRARDTDLNRIVAIKFVPQTLTGDPQILERFTRESRAAAAVHHENIVTIYSVDQLERVPFLVQQFVEGKSLQQVLDEKTPISSRQVLEWIRQTASGLKAAHASGLVHRDIKPSNLLIEQATGTIKISDFGLAQLQSDSSLTKSGVLAATPQYMSPEQAQLGEVDARSDLFSLGTVLYACLCGQSPFKSESIYGVIKNVCDLPTPELAKSNETTHHEFQKLLERLHQKNPSQRFQSADELLSAIQRIQNGNSQVSSPKSNWLQPVIIGGAILATALVIILTFFSIPNLLNSTLDPIAHSEKANKVNEVFRIGNQPYSSLESAIDSAKANETITIRTNGTVYLEPQVIDVPLSIKSAAGFKPTISSTASKEDARGTPLLTSKADLRLEGLVLIHETSPRDQASFSSYQPFTQFSVIKMEQGNLDVRQCHIRSGSRNTCIAVLEGQLNVQDCVLESLQGSGILQRFRDNGSTVITNTLLRTRRSLIHWMDEYRQSGKPHRVQIDQCTFYGETAHFMFIEPRPPGQPIRKLPDPFWQIDGSNNIFHGQKYLTARRLDTSARTGASSADNGAYIRLLFDWRIRDSIYSEVRQFVSFSQGSRPPTTVIANARRWKAYWKRTDGNFYGRCQFEQDETKRVSDFLAPPKLKSVSGRGTESTKINEWLETKSNSTKWGFRPLSQESQKKPASE